MDREDLDIEVKDLLFNVRRSRRYHEWRIKFFRRINATRIVLVFLSTSVAFIGSLKLGQLGYLIPWLTGIAAVFAGFEYGARLSDRERLHEKLLRSFVELERAIVAEESKITETDLGKFRAAQLEIELDEPPILHTLNDLCYNAEVRARFVEEDWQKHMIKVSLPKRLLATLYDLFPAHVTNQHGVR